MNSEQIKLIQESFAKIPVNDETVASIFYGRLFELDPGLRSMFKGDMSEQGRKLMTMIRIVVNGLDRLEALIPAVEALGRRHVGYGTRPEHYMTVGAALLGTLRQGLGEEFTLETEVAWRAAYVTLADVMQDAAARMEMEMETSAA